MLAYMNEESIKMTLESGHATYFSRSRQELWEKGSHSGHLQLVKEILVDCDMDAIVLKIEQIGAACHTGHPSCFYRKIVDGKTLLLRQRIMLKPRYNMKQPIYYITFRLSSLNRDLHGTIYSRNCVRAITNKFRL